MAASAALILRESPSMKKAVSLINEIDIGRFPRLLTRILQKLHLKAENSFSEEEEEKLQAAFSLERQDLHLVLETISFILEQLETVGWQLNLQMAHSAQAKLKSPQAVLQLGVSNEDSKIKPVSPEYSRAIWMHPFHLEKLPGNLPRKSLKKVLVEFSHKELFDFYNKLETIQAQLDSLT
ncbi:COMM domain-containing protein 10 isoform X7 [Kogia breviceps]|uniref:COMM domain-containing protein 10 isoform X7 n=1 Tax=Kogia breviceps TaxID=27615 RepID=UPI0034D1E627